MNRLTFQGFTKKYVSSLSANNSTGLYALAREVQNNPRLKEPLFLYAASHGKVHVLLRATKDPALHSEYLTLANNDEIKNVEAALECQCSFFTEGYHKVWQSYKSVLLKPKRDANVKSLYRDKVRNLLNEKHVSVYRMCEDLMLNKANVNAWLKHGDPNKVRLETVRRMFTYLETTVNPF